MAVDGTPGVVFVHCTPGGVRDEPACRCSHVNFEQGGFGVNEILTSYEVDWDSGPARDEV